MDENIQLLIEAILSLKDPEKSASQIKDDLPKVEDALNKDEDARVKLVGKLDITKTVKSIQEQLKTIKETPTIELGIEIGNQNATQGVVQGLKDVQTQAQQIQKTANQTAQSITNLADKFTKPIKPVLNKDGLIDAEETIMKAQRHFKELGEVSVKGIYGDRNSVDSLDRMIVKVKALSGETRSLNFELDEMGESFYLKSGTSDNSGIEKLIASTQKAENKVKSLRINLMSELQGIRQGWEDVNGSKSVKDNSNIENLKRQYISVAQAIRQLKNADASTLPVMQSNVDKQIDKLKRMVSEYHNAEKVATQLRAKGFETVKVDTGNNIDKFINSINNSKVPISAMRTEIEALKNSFASLDNIQGQSAKSSALTGVLNQLDNAQTKFQALKELFKGFGTTNWLSVNADQIKKIDDATTRVTIYKETLKQAKVEWGTQITSVDGINNKLKSLNVKLGGIKKPEALNKWFDEFTALNAQAINLKANLDSQAASQTKIYEIQAQIARLNPTKDTAEITRLNEKLNLEQSTLSNLKMQSNVFSNLVTLEEQEKYITEQTVVAREKMLSATNSGIKAYTAQVKGNLRKLQALQNQATFRNNASNPQVAQTKADIASLIGEYQNLKVQLQGDITLEGLKQIETALTTLNFDFNDTTTSAKNLQTELADANGADKLAQRIKILISRIEVYKSTNAKAMKTFGGTFDEMLTKLNSGELDKIGVDKLEKQFRDLQLEIKRTGKAGQTFFQKLKEQAKKFTSWMTLTGMITGAWHEIRKMVTNVVELDNSLLELSKVSDLSAAGLRNITKEAYNMGKEVGKTGTQVLDAITNFKRAGFSIADSTNFAKDALILTNVAEGIDDAGEAATALISIMKGYGDTTPEFSQKILDAINQVSNTQAINFDELVDGSQRLSAVAKQSGASFEQMLGILTGTNEVLQNIEKTSSGEITIFTRLQGIQLPDEEDVMPIAKLQETISRATNGAANIVDQTTGELRNVYNILDDINEVWDTLDKNTQEGIAFAAAGTRQKNVFLSMMENWENVESATKSAMGSMGSSAEENQKYLDSISGKLANLESSFQSLSNTVVNSDLIKFLVDAGAGILNFLDNTIEKLGAIPTLLTAISAGMAIKNVGGLLNTPVYVQPQLICA